MRISTHFWLSTMYVLFITMPIQTTLHSKVELLEWTFLLRLCLQQVVMGSMYFWLYCLFYYTRSIKRLSFQCPMTLSRVPINIENKNFCTKISRAINSNRNR